MRIFLMKDFKKVFIGMKPVIVISSFTWTIIWGMFNAYFSGISADVLTTEMAFIPKLITSLTIYIVIWAACEFMGDCVTMLGNYVLECEFQTHYMTRLYSVKPSVLKANNTGYITTLMSKVMSWQSKVFDDILETLISLGYVGYFFVLFIGIDWVFAVELVVLVVVANACRIITRLAFENKYYDIATESEAERNRLVYDAVANINTVQKMYALKFMQRELGQKRYEVLHNGKKSALLKETGFIINKLMLNSAVPIFLYTLYVRYPNGLPEELTILVLACGVRLVYSGRQFSRFISDFSEFRVRLHKLDRIIGEDNLRNNDIIDNFKSLHIKNAIHTYEYMGSGENKGKTITVAIDDFRLNKGDKICVYGESGQGKTTLLNIISREIDCGDVFINDEKTDSRIRCTFIAQDTEILDMSLRNNLSMGRSISDDKLIEYLYKVGMGKWFESQPDGLDTILGERGVFVSTGQRQRLNLIRGLLDVNYSDVFLLDEPTSNVDEETESTLIELIAEDLKDKTLVVVTHKPAIKDICNRHYLFEDGVCQAVS